MNQAWERVRLSGIESLASGQAQAHLHHELRNTSYQMDISEAHKLKTQE